MAAGLLPSLANFLLLPVYTRFLTPSDYGLVALVTAFTSFLSPVLGFQLTNSLSRMYFDFDGEGVKAFFSTIFFSIVLLNLSILLPIHLFGEQISGLIFPRASIPYRPFVLIGLVAVFFRSLVNLFNLMLRVQERGTTLILVSVLNTLLAVSFGLYFIVFAGLGAYGLLLSLAWSAATNFLTLFLVLRKFIVPAFHIAKLKSALVYSLPMIPHGIGGMLYMYSDRYILGLFLPLSSVGLYDIAVKISTILKMVVASFNSAILPTFMRSSIESKRQTAHKFKTIITKWSVAMALFYLAMSIFAREVLFILTPPRFHAAHSFVPILLAAYVFRGLQGFPINAILFEKKTVFIPLITFSTGALNIAANIFFIPRWGIMTAAWTTLASFAIAFLLTVLLANRHYRITFEWRKIAVIFSSSLAILFTTSFLPDENLWLNTAFKAGGLLAFLYLMIKLNYGEFGDAFRRLCAKATVRAG